jgi:hypothetical protein
MRSIVWCALLLVAGCYQVHHTTHVREGTHVAIAMGVAHVTPRPQPPPQFDPPDEPEKDRTGADGLIAIAMGMRHGHAGFLFQGTIPVTTFQYDANPRQTWSGPSFGFFVSDDSDDDHLSIGIGTSIGLRGSVYSQLGFRPWPSAKNGLSIDIGGRIDTARVAAPYGMVTMQLGNLDIGAWVDHSFYLAEPALVNDDPTDVDYSAQRFSAGLLLRGVVSSYRRPASTRSP